MSDTIFKGTKGPLTSRVRRTWRRGSGWNSTVTYNGEEKAVHGQLPGMLAYCNEITIEEGGGPYCAIEGTWAGFIDGKTADTDLLTVWELVQKEDGIDLLLSKVGRANEASMPGFVLAVRKAITEFRKLTDAIPANYVPQAIVDFANLTNPVDTFRVTKAMGFFNLIISGSDQITVFKPVLSRTLVVSQAFGNYPVTPDDPLVYDSTDVLVDALNVPETIAKALPPGDWLENPPQIQQTAGERFSVSQTWEWYREISSVIYTNRVD